MRFHVAAATVLLAWLAGVAGAARADDGLYRWDLPPGVPAPQVPADAPMTMARVELGRHLFYDARLSGNGTQACSNCHQQALAFTNGTDRSTGSTGELHPRNAQTLVNVAYRDTLNWANPALHTLEAHALVPLLGTTPVELGMAGFEADVYARLEADDRYPHLFAAAFPDAAAPVTTDNIARALAAFQRSIVSFNSPFDRHRLRGDASAMSDAAERGAALFFGAARCATCHQGLNLDGGSKTVATPDNEPGVFPFQNTGLFNLPGPFSYPRENTGLHEFTGEPGDMGRFRVPTLRNIAATSPYMHDGSVRTLDEVLDHYAAGGRTNNPHKSPLLSPLTLTPGDRSDLIAFLRSLTDQDVLRDPRWSNPWRASTAAAR